MVVQTSPRVRPEVEQPGRKPSRLPAAARTLAGWALVIGAWELAGRTVLAGRHLVGVPSGVAVKLVDNAEVYFRGL